MVIHKPAALGKPLKSEASLYYDQISSDFGVIEVDDQDEPQAPRRGSKRPLLSQVSHTYYIGLNDLTYT